MFLFGLLQSLVIVLVGETANNITMEITEGDPEDLFDMEEKLGEGFVLSIPTSKFICKSVSGVNSYLITEPMVSFANA